MQHATKNNQNEKGLFFWLGGAGLSTHHGVAWAELGSAPILTVFFWADPGSVLLRGAYVGEAGMGWAGLARGGRGWRGLAGRAMKVANPESSSRTTTFGSPALAMQGQDLGLCNALL